MARDPELAAKFRRISPTNHMVATTGRHWVLLMLFLAAMLTYLDRVCLSAAAPAMSKDLHLTPIQMGYVFGIFNLAYALFEIPMSWQGDRTGQRKLLTRIVACWSIFTVLTGLARSYTALLAIRFGFGAAESGAFPTMSRALARWFPASDRAKATGVMWTGARLGGAAAPALAVLLIQGIGWRTMFASFGTIGVIWCVLFSRWYRDDPADHPSVNSLELAIIRGETSSQILLPRQQEATPWYRILSSRNLWTLFAMYFCSAFGFQFFVTWLPTFLIKDHGLSFERSGLYSAIPLASGALGCLLGGALSDWLVSVTGNLEWSRRSIGVGGFLLAAAGFGLAAAAHNSLTAVLLLALSAGAHDLTLPVAWATCLDIGGRHGGTTGGIMNMASCLSAMLSPVSAAWLSTKFGSFNSMLVVVAATYVVGGLLWLYIDPAHPVSD
jgi:ACS family glucarate transporter-like MFS transporter